jgi:hypothetical protein
MATSRHELKCGSDSDSDALEHVSPATHGRGRKLELKARVCGRLFLAETNRAKVVPSDDFCILRFEYPPNPQLRYRYPELTPSTLLNIANAIASVPKLYTQVLHLMNKMSLPPPFFGPQILHPINEVSGPSKTELCLCPLL